MVTSFVRQLSIATLGHALEKIIALVVVTVLVHRIDKALMGAFFFAVSVCTVAALVNEFGTSRYLVRSVAQDRERAAAHLGNVLGVRLPLLALTVVVINCIVAISAPHLLTIFVFTSIYVLFENLYYAFGSTLLGIGAVTARVATGLVGPLLLLAFVPAAALWNWPLDRIVVIYAAATSVMAVIAYLVVVRRVGPVTMFRAAAPARSVVAQWSLLFAVNAVMLLHSRIDEWMLAAMRDFSEVAGYAAGYKLAEVSRSAIRPITMVLFPLFAAGAGQAAWEQVRMHAKRAFWAAASISALVAASVIAVAPWIVPLLFGRDYAETVGITRVLFLATPALFVGYVAMLLNSSLYLDKGTLVFALVSLLLNFVLNLVAIPRWGAIGAAWTTLITESLLTLALVSFAFHRLSASGSRVVETAS